MRKVRFFNEKNILLLWLLAAGLLFNKAVCLHREEACRTVKEDRILQTTKFENIEGANKKEIVEEISKKDNIEEEYKQEPQIRVLITTTGFKSCIHEKVEGECDGKDFMYTAHSSVFDNQDVVRIESKEKIRLNSIERQCGNPVYEGVLELSRSGDGIVVINEIPVEKYLESVVPSEMPASYEKEALKAQAICARTYAWKHILGNGIEEFDADVDDSVNYQVYGNIEVQEGARRAVVETKDQILCQNGSPVEAYYFSTSSGATSTDEIWGATEAASYLKSVSCPFDKDTSWSNWKTTIPWEILEQRAQSYANKNGELLSVEILKKTQSGAAIQLQVVLDDSNFLIEGENVIRRFLAPDGYEIIEKNGVCTTGGTLLPSAYFSMELNPGEKVFLEGRGYGHGVGMSQTAANEMAKRGYTCQEILEYFFRDVEIHSCRSCQGFHFVV